MEVGLKIMKYLKSNGISQRWLAERTNITPAKLNLSLNGKRRMTFEEYECICGALGVGVDAFISARAPKAM